MAIQQNTIKEAYTGPETEPITGVVEEFGKAPLNFKADGEQSYFVKLNVNGKTQVIWGKALEDTYLGAYVSVGDEITVTDMGIGKRMVPANRWDGKQWVASQMSETTRLWDVDHGMTAKERAEQAGVSEVGGSIKEAPVPADGLGDGKKHPTQQLPAAQLPQPEKLGNGAFLRNEKGEYCPAGTSKAKIVDKGDTLTVKSNEMAVFEAALELVRAKGWEGIELSGTKEFKSEAWLLARSAGLRVTGYVPDEKDLARLEAQVERNEREEANSGKAVGTISEKAPEKVAVTAHTFDSNYADAVNFVMEKGGGVRAVNAKQDVCNGPISFQNDTHLVQHLGRDKYVVHDRSKIAGVGVADEKGKSLRIVYGEGQGKVVPPKEKSKDLGR